MWPTFAGLVLMPALACAPKASNDNGDAVERGIGTANVIPTASLPDSQFARFLSLALATRMVRAGMFDSVYTREGRVPTSGEIEDVSGPCPEDYQEARWLADYRVLSVIAVGDSAEATAEITTVAREMENGAERRATLDVRQDTAHWRLVRSDLTEGRWKVCGDAREGFGLFLASPTHVRWSNKGTAEKARAAIDSIRRARGLPLAR